MSWERAAHGGHVGLKGSSTHCVQTMSRLPLALAEKKDGKQLVFTKKYFLSSSSKIGIWQLGRLRPRLVGDL